MADTSGLTAAQAIAAATAGAPRVTVVQVTHNVALKDSQFRFYVGDAVSPGVHVEARNQEFVTDMQLSALPSTVLSSAEVTALQGLLAKLHVGLVMP